MKKLNILLILCIFLLISTMGYGSRKEKKILKVISEAIPDDNFYFVGKLKKRGDFITGYVYRGFVYSDKLKENKVSRGINISISSRHMDRISMMYSDTFEMQYENAFYYDEAVAPVRKKAREIFGEDIIIWNQLKSWSVKARVMSLRRSLKGENEKKKGYMSEQTVVDVFVDDITKIDEDEFKKKTFEFYRYMYDKLMIDSQMSIYVRDRKYLTYEGISSKISLLFKEEPKIQGLLKKYKEDGRLNPDEMGYLMSYFVVPFRNYDVPYILFEAGIRDKDFTEVNRVYFNMKK